MIDTLQHGLGLAAVLLGLSIAVQIVQEIFKFVTTAKTRAYRKALRDFLGDKLAQALESKELNSLFVRGPFQWRSSREPVKLLPMDKATLLHAITRTQPKTAQETLEILAREAETQGGLPTQPSALLRKCVRELWPQVQDDGCAAAMFAFLERWGVAVRPPDEPGQAEVTYEAIDAQSILVDFSRTFVPKWQRVEEEFDQFAENFAYWYQRRNLRLTIVFGFLLTVGLNLPFDSIYLHVARQSPEQLARLTQATIELYDRQDPSSSVPDQDAEAVDDELAELNQRLRTALAATLDVESDGVLYRRGWCHIGRMWSPAVCSEDAEAQAEPRPVRWYEPGPTLLLYLFNCLVTALLISFGAPFWHRLTKTLLGLSTQLNAARNERTEEVR